MNILVIGKNSYIGTSFFKYAQHQHHITLVSSRNGAWKDADFSKADVVLFVAGIAHIPQVAANKDLYYQVNCHLAVEVASHAKAAGVLHFIYLSSMAVYGLTTGEITPATPLQARDFYGHSKIQAETALAQVGIPLCIIRPPMVYGPNAPGNFPRLVKLVEKLPIFPNIHNQRSMIFIDHLCQFILQAITAQHIGIYTPQNAELVSTTQLAQLIAQVKGKKLPLTRVFNPALRRIPLPQLRKLFGTLIYRPSGNEATYSTTPLAETIAQSIHTHPKE